MAEIFGTNLNTIKFPEFTDNVERAFITHMKLIKPQARRLYIMDPIGFNNGDTLTYNEYDGETFASHKAEGVDAAKAKAGLGYEKSGKVRRFAKEIDITFEMRRFNKVPRVISELKSLREFIPQREELDLTHRLTFGTSSSYTDRDGASISVTMGDGNPLFYATHKLAGTSITYRNRVTSDPLFAKGSFETAMDLTVTDVLSNLGERRVIDFKVIYSADDFSLVHDIKQFLRSVSDGTQNNPGVVNTHAGTMEHVVLPYLATTATGARDSTKRLWWGVCAPGMGGWNAYLAIAEPANMKPSFEDTHNDNWTLGVRGGRAIIVVGGRGIIGSCPVTS